MRVLITGGTGFVGGWTAKAIQDAGHEVRFLVRDPARLATSVATLGVDTGDFVVGDMTDAEAVKTALTGCDAVVHAAAVVTTDPKRAEEMIEANLVGARNVLGQAVDLGLDPIVSVSSITALFQPDLETFSADLPPSGGGDGYGVSKTRVEDFSRELQESGAPVVITYPGMVMGPAAGNQLGEAAEGVESVLRMRTVPGRSAAWTIIDVRDLGLLHALLITPGKGPRRFMAGGQQLVASRLARVLSQSGGKRIVHVPVPDVVLRLMGRAADAARPVLPALLKDVTAAGMDYYTHMPPSDDRPAEAELGMTWRPTEQTLTDTVTSLRAIGRLR
jgi:nucleoside-diphosphate-sugar epimerase